MRCRGAFQVGSPQAPRLSASESEAQEVHKRGVATIPTDKDRPLNLLDSVLPTSPSESLRGTVEVRFVVDEHGLIESARVITSPDDRLSEASLNAIRQWRFESMTKHGQPVKIRLSQTFTFNPR